MRSSVHDPGALVLPRVGVKHPSAPHYVGHHVKVPAQIGITQVGEYRAVAVHLLDVVRKALLGYAHQEALANVLSALSVEQGEVDLCVLADRVTKVPHAVVKVMGQDLFGLPTSQGASTRRTLRVLCALNVLKKNDR